MFRAIDIAVWFLLKNQSEMKEYESKNDNYEVYEGITHLKLQKLLYYAQGVCLAITNQPLFGENIEVWTHGPVVREVYDIYKDNGKNVIELDLDTIDSEKIIEIENNSQLSNILQMVYDNFAIYTAWQLREMTHEIGSPWDIATKNNKSVIDIDTIKDYFEREVVTSV